MPAAQNYCERNGKSIRLLVNQQEEKKFPRNYLHEKWIALDKTCGKA